MFKLYISCKTICYVRDCFFFSPGFSFKPTWNNKEWKKNSKTETKIESQREWNKRNTRCTKERAWLGDKFGKKELSMCMVEKGCWDGFIKGEGSGPVGKAEEEEETIFLSSSQQKEKGRR